MAKRRSPDSVIYIDLTEDDDERQDKLQDVRKRLKGTPAALAPSVMNVESQAITVDLDDGNGGGKIGSCAALQQQAIKKEQNRSQFSSEVEIVEPVARTIHPVASAQAESSIEHEEDIVVVGTANESRLPHMRQHCQEHKFSPIFQSSNLSFCDLCFCYVCDKPAKECNKWGMYHCHASDTGPLSLDWIRLRNEEKQGPKKVDQEEATQPVQATPSSRVLGAGPFEPGHELASNDPDLTECRKCGWYNRFRPRNIANPFQPRLDDSHLLQPGCLGWCHSCGRVASKNDFGKLQAQQYVRKPDDLFLGEKVIPFRLVAHDPRNFEAYQEKWAKYSGSDPKWTFSEAEMEQDLFDHRFGKLPLLGMILLSIPIVAEDKIPKTVPAEEKETWKEHRSMDDDYDSVGYNWYEDQCHYDSSDYDSEGYRTKERTCVKLSNNETEGLILDRPCDRILLEELLNFNSIGVKKPMPTATLIGDIVANWNASARSGTFTVRVYIRRRICNDCDNASLARFLGLWFGIFPFSLEDLSGQIRAKEIEKPSRHTPERIIVPPFLIDSSKKMRAFDNFTMDMRGEVETHNDKVKAKVAHFSLDSSTDSNSLGGTCSTETGLTGILKRYYRETFAEDVCLASRIENQSTNRAWLQLASGAISRHRSMLEAEESLFDKNLCPSSVKLRRLTNLESYLTEKDQIFAISNLPADCKVTMEKTQSMKGMLNHLENLHHPAVPFVTGLTVELLDFQRQSVQWAFERETTPGGVQSFLWAKLPFVEEPGQDLYFSPILNWFRRDKPNLVRGGFISEEMGLGKTVISLALILQNPAPVRPLSGSPVEVLAVESGGATKGQSSWDGDLYARTSGANSKRGSILSQGTLVVCHVSLVGQWIDEARSKLTDPGLLYRYHGQSRERDATRLAKNSIVVTTYQVLASDATHHARKGGPNYCAPCEQVRWWRIICDESHSLREASTKRSAAVLNLVADHKWLVSGTPVNTSFKDLKNQLKFIGIERVDEMFAIFMRTAFQHTNDQCVPRKSNCYSDGDDRVFGHFMFLLRCIMIRHTQTQKYRGTLTTLMSLPPKVERSVEVDFTDEEKQEYTALDDAARIFYYGFKAKKGHKLSKHYLLLTQKLMPLRIAAAGGHVPLDDENGKFTEDSDDETKEEAKDSTTEAPKKKKAKKEQRYSDFVYKSKFNALLDELKRARDEDPNAKSLVFSQFTSTLGFLQQELPKHGFQFRTLSGDMSMAKRARALHDFQYDPPTTVFLLSMRAGAVGINLTQANRVFLMEPSFNPALEAQAIGRVHRLGQKRNVEIVRFVMKDSVESRIVKMIEKKYGGPTTSNDAEGDDGVKKLELATLVGSIHTDRTSVLGEEFDILFGASGIPSASSEEEAEVEMEGDPVPSSIVSSTSFNM